MITRIISIVVALAALGLVLYLMLGKNQKSWHSMTEDEQKRKKTLVTGGLIVFLSGLLTAIFLGKKK
jgi:uncharacterized membrane protein YfcA